MRAPERLLAERQTFLAILEMRLGDPTLAEGTVQCAFAKASQRPILLPALSFRCTRELPC